MLLPRFRVKLMKLICSLTSPYARRVRVLAHELGIIDDLEIHIVRPRESSDYLWKINPMGKVPTLRLADGSAIFDSLIICDYLIATYAPDWGLEHQTDYWEYRTRLSLLNQTSDAGSQARKLLAQEPPQTKAADFQLDKVHRSLTHLETTWSMLETELSLSSIGLACTFDWLLDRFPEINWTNLYPRIGRWFDGFKMRDSMQKTQIQT
jgi:glutathione S-transferase